MSIDDGRMIIEFIRQSFKNEPITVFGDGKQTRSLCYVSDTVDGMFKLMVSPNTKGQIVNIGSPDEHTVLEYAEMVKKLMDSQSEIIFSEALPQDDPLRRKADTARAKELLDWTPQVSLSDGLSKMIDYVKTFA